MKWKDNGEFNIESTNNCNYLVIYTNNNVFRILVIDKFQSAARTFILAVTLWESWLEFGYQYHNMISPSLLHQTSPWKHWTLTEQMGEFPFYCIKCGGGYSKCNAPGHDANCMGGQDCYARAIYIILSRR